MKFIKDTMLERANSKEEFFHSLRMIGLGTVYIGNNPIGVKDGNKVIKWRSLGITAEDFKMLNQRREISELRNRISHLEWHKDISQQHQKLDPTIEKQDNHNLIRNPEFKLETNQKQNRELDQNRDGINQDF